MIWSGGVFSKNSKYLNPRIKKIPLPIENKNKNVEKRSFTMDLFSTIVCSKKSILGSKVINPKANNHGQIRDMWSPRKARGNALIINKKRADTFLSPTQTANKDTLITKKSARRNLSESPQIIPSHSQWFESLRIFLNLLGPLRIFPNLSESFQILAYLSESNGITPNISECLRICSIS